MKYIRLHRSLLTQSKIDKEITLLSKWLSFKHINRNGLFYNYNPNKASNRYKEVYGIKIDPKTVKRSVNSFIQRGWCELTVNGHLKFNRQKQITEDLDSKGYVTLDFSGDKFTDYKTIRIKIYEYLLHSNFNTQDLFIDAEHDLSKMKKAERVFSFNTLNKQKDIMDDVLNISFDGMAKLFGTSKSQAFYIMNDLIKRTEIKKLQRRINVTKEGGIDTEHGFVFIHKGQTIVSFTNEYYY